jgi:hypothetical protein
MAYTGLGYEALTAAREFAAAKGRGEPYRPLEHAEEIGSVIGGIGGIGIGTAVMGGGIAGFKAGGAPGAMFGALVIGAAAGPIGSYYQAQRQLSESAETLAVERGISPLRARRESLRFGDYQGQLGGAVGASDAMNILSSVQNPTFLGTGDDQLGRQVAVNLTAGRRFRYGKKGAARAGQNLAPFLSDPLMGQRFADEVTGEGTINDRDIIGATIFSGP